MEVKKGTNIRFLVEICSGGISVYVIMFGLNIFVRYWESFIFLFC